MNLNHLEGKELFKALKTNKDEIIKAKTSAIKYADPIVATTTTIREHKVSAVKAETSSDEDSSSIPGTIDVKVVCNTAWFCDSHMDVLTDTAYDSSIETKGISIPHIADHVWESTSHVGDVKKVYTEELPLRSLGISTAGTTTALIMESTIRKDYNDDVYKFYANGKINQHSIGLTYKSLSLALNSDDPEYSSELALWEEYFPKIINKELVQKRGYFWLVSDVDVIENSCVLFGANSLTPTLAAKGTKDTTSSNKSAIHPTTINEETMKTVEQLQAEVTRLEAELVLAKADSTNQINKALSEDRQRILGIQKAAAEYGIKGSLEKFIVKGASIEDSVDTFEIIKEQTQLGNPSPKGEGAVQVNTKDNTTEFSEENKGFKSLVEAMGQAPNTLFKNIA